VSTPVRVRFAPSPTGHLHIGGARTAIYNWAFARHHGGAFVLRIDDTDRERSTEENTQAILRAMRWLGLDWDEGPEVGGDAGPYYQTQRTESYATALEVLKAKGHAYPCFCTTEELEAKRSAASKKDSFWGYDRACRSIAPDAAATRIAAGEPHVWRVKVPDGRADITIQDVIRGTVTWPIDVMDDFILARTDGSPTYMFATVVDDWQMDITHIIRGDDHLSNTPRQIVVYEALEAPVPVFAHMSLIFGADGKRLSKRHGATSVESYRDEGYLPETLLNYLSLLGWSIDDKTTLFDRETLVREFNLSRVSSNPAIWDPEKLEWMNGVYLRDMPVERFAGLIAGELADAGLLTAEETSAHAEWLTELAPLVSERVKRTTEIVPMIAFLFAEKIEVEESARAKVLEKEGAAAALDATADALAALTDFSPAAIEEALRAVPERVGVKPKIVFQAVRVAITGSTVSLPLFESLALLGKERSLERIRAARSLATA
jgi:glutamyl-tRNA synthetase